MTGFPDDNAADDDDLVPPPGGFERDPVAAGPAEHQTRALDRIADAVEKIQTELSELRKLLIGGLGRR